MKNNNYSIPYTYERFDGSFGIVEEKVGKGAVICLENGEYGFSYNAGNLENGAEVYCSILRVQENRCFKYLVSVDNVCDMYMTA